MGGGEDLFFPLETPICSPEEIDEALTSDDGPVATIPATCVVHRPACDTLDADGPSATGGLRTYGLNLAQAAVDEGYTLVRTRTEFDRLVDAVGSDEVDPARSGVLLMTLIDGVTPALRGGLFDVGTAREIVSDAIERTLRGTPALL